MSTSATTQGPPRASYAANRAAAYLEVHAHHRTGGMHEGYDERPTIVFVRFNPSPRPEHTQHGRLFNPTRQERLNTLLQVMTDMIRGDIPLDPGFRALLYHR